MEPARWIAYSAGPASLRGRHTRYLSIYQLCTAAVLMSSPAFGLAVDVAGFEPVILAVTALIAGGGMLTFRLVEPRAAGA